MKILKMKSVGLSLILMGVTVACGSTTDKKPNGSGAANHPSVIDNKVHDEVVSSNQEKVKSLVDAALNGDSALVTKLISEGVNVNAVVADGRNALMQAAFNGHLNIMNMLVNARAEVDVKDNFGRTPLIYASTGFFPEAIKFLLDNGAEVNTVDKQEKFSALMFAAAEGHAEVVKILLENDVDPTLKDKDGETAEEFARQNGHTEIADLISKSY